MAITKYKDRHKNTIIIREMDDGHLMNAYYYFIDRREDMIDAKRSGVDLFHISLLINALLQEISRRGLFEY
jgi:hypothetical protein